MNEISDETIRVRVPSKLKKKLKSNAKKQNRTLSAYIKILLGKVVGKK